MEKICIKFVHDQILWRPLLLGCFLSFHTFYRPTGPHKLPVNFSSLQSQWDLSFNHNHSHFFQFISLDWRTTLLKMSYGWCKLLYTLIRRYGFFLFISVTELHIQGLKSLLFCSLSISLLRKHYCYTHVLDTNLLSLEVCGFELCCYTHVFCGIQYHLDLAIRLLHIRRISLDQDFLRLLLSAGEGSKQHIILCEKIKIGFGKSLVGNIYLHCIH